MADGLCSSTACMRWPTASHTQRSTLTGSATLGRGQLTGSALSSHPTVKDGLARCYYDIVLTLLLTCDTAAWHPSQAAPRAPCPQVTPQATSRPRSLQVQHERTVPAPLPGGQSQRDGDGQTASSLLT